MPRRKKVTAEGSASLRSGISINKEKPQQRNAANARERARMRVLSRAFCRLKTTLPWVPADTKLSKLDTLKLASAYIAHLDGVLKDDPYKPEEPLHPSMTLTWPFGFNRLGVVSGSGGGGSDGGDENGVLDDGENSCGSSGSSWEEVSRTDRVHLVSAPCINKTIMSSSYMSPPPLYQHPPTYHESIYI